MKYITQNLRYHQFVKYILILEMFQYIFKRHLQLSDPTYYYGFNYDSRKEMWKSNPRYLWTWPYLETESLRILLVKMRLYWIRVSPITMTCAPLKRTETQRRTGRMPCHNGDRDWSTLSASEWMPKIAGKHQKLKRNKGDSLKLWEKAWSCWHLAFGLPAPRTMRK